MAHIILVRHGQTAWNREERYRGHYEIPLNETGIKQAAAAGRRIAGAWKPVAVYASPMGRALETAEQIAIPLGLPVQPHVGLNDIDFGDWEGKTVEEVRQQWPELQRAFIKAPQTVTFPHGESLLQVQERALSALTSLNQQHGDDTVVLVSHTVVNRLIILGILHTHMDRFWRLGQENCAINQIRYEHGDFSLLSLNDAQHIQAL